MMKSLFSVAAMLVLLAGTPASASTYTKEDLFSAINFMMISIAAHDKFTGEESPEGTDNEMFRFMGHGYVPVSLRQMRETIETNELAAELEYDKPFVVTGEIDKITRLMGTPIVKLKPKAEEGELRLISAVSAYFSDEDTPKLAKLAKGKTLTIACKEWNYSMAVSFEDCRLMSDYYEDYQARTNALKITKAFCQARPKARNVFWAKMFDAMDQFSDIEISEIVSVMINTEKFFYIGFDGEFNDGKVFKKFEKIGNSIAKEVGAKKGLTAEDC